MASPSESPPRSEPDPHVPNPSSPLNPQYEDQQDQSPLLPRSPQIPTPENTDRNLENTEQTDPPADTQNQPEEQDEEELRVLDQDQGPENQPEEQQRGMPTLSPPYPPCSLTSPTQGRRHNKRKKGGFNKMKLQAIEKKVQTLIKNIKPIPFTPAKTLDFEKHEKLLKKLDLWDFVHIEFDQNIRTDLIAQLIVNYDHKQRCSHVNGLRINLNRPTLGRALKLPVKKDKGAQEALVLDLEDYEEEAPGFLEDFLSNWVLLHDDMWLMPNEVLTLTKDIKDGHPEKVDWTGLIWFMVEKELNQGQKLKNCYYVSHLQFLLKSQREEFFGEEPKMEPREVEGAGLDKAVEADDDETVVVEEPNVELTLGQENVERQEVNDGDTMDAEESKDGNLMMDVDEIKDNVTRGNWVLDGRNSAGGHFLQHCNMEEDMNMVADEVHKLEDDERKLEAEEEVERKFGGEVNVEDEEEVGEEDDEDYSLTPKIHHSMGMDGLTGNLLHGMGTNHIPFSVTDRFESHQLNIGVLPTRKETYSSSGGSLIFGQGIKREIAQDHDVLHDSLNVSNKRLRTDGSCGSKSSELEMFTEQVQHLIGTFRMAYETKEMAIEESSRNQQFYLGEIQRRDNMIEHLQKIRFEELQKKDEEILRLERELFVMGNVVQGYREICKATQKKFAEYRQQAQLPEVPVYKDVGPGGLMLSTMEIERRQLKEEEEERKREEEDKVNRMIVEQEMKEFEEKCVGEFKGYLDRIQMMDEKLLGLEREVSLLKELSSAKDKVSDAVDDSATLNE